MIGLGTKRFEAALSMSAFPLAGSTGRRNTGVKSLHATRPPGLTDGLVVALRGGVLRRTVSERSRACLAMARAASMRRRTLPVCRANDLRRPEPTPAMMTIKTATLSYR